MAQPPPSKLSPRGLLSLPYRLCNPPPAVGKVRSCGATPMLDVRLDDVLARRHLPPIGLKDFEEYLLYVEQAPENLYFTLWLKEYTTRYNAWIQREKYSLVHKKEKLASKLHPSRHSFYIPPTPDPSLAMFYARAKQTFFTPNAEYELNIPSDVLAPFHCTSYNAGTQARKEIPVSPWHSQSVHPDPAVFTEVAIEVRNMLNESLTRFVRAAFTNVGSRRAACGIIAGCAATLIGGVLPLVLTTGRWNIGPHGRLIRLVAFPGMWLGLTILIASLQGICLMVYIFGDLRQLRKFELARPAISRPMPMPISAPVLQLPARASVVTAPTTAVSIRSREKFMGQVEAEKSSAPVSPATITSASSFTRPRLPFLQTPTHNDTSEANSEDESTSCDSCESGSCSSVSCNEIDVSPAFFDEVPAPEGPATASCLYRPEYRAPVSQSQQQLGRSTSLASLEPVHVRSSPGRCPVTLPVPIPSSFGHNQVDPGPSPRSTLPRGVTNLRQPGVSVPDYGPSAGFIPRDYSTDGSSSGTLRSRSGMESFDFDLLPEGKKAGFGWRGEGVPCQGVIQPLTGQNVPGRTQPQSQLPLQTQIQTQTQMPGSTSTTAPEGPGSGPLLSRVQYKCAKRTQPSTTQSSTPTPSPTSRYSFHSSFALLIPSFTAGVPAFAAPFTQVRSEIVRRAQWEVVVRAGLAAFVCTGLVIGVIVGVVP